MSTPVPEYRAEFEKASREITAIDAIVNELDGLREAHGLTKAELAREIGKNPASVRRLLTAPANPELRTVIAMADALDADLVIVPRKSRARRAGSADRKDDQRHAQEGQGRVATHQAVTVR
jgi:transcriptional regulator with XRE-family HTH domain